MKVAADKGSVKGSNLLLILLGSLTLLAAMLNPNPRAAIDPASAAWLAKPEDPSTDPWLPADGDSELPPALE